MSVIDLARWCVECFPGYNGQLYMNLSDISNLFGLSADNMRRFIADKKIPHYSPVGRKLYCVPEVAEAITGTRWTKGK